jgi:non-heme chloroperoxidase
MTDHVAQGEGMPTITNKDGAKTFYKDWGKGQPIVFIHGWPLNADSWDEQLHFFATNGYRAVAPDRRGHGRSTQTLQGNDMETYADDLETLMKELDLKKAILVGHSTGGGVVARYIGKYGAKRVAKAVLVDAVPPGLVKNGFPIAELDKLRAAIKADRPQFWKDFAIPFYGANRPGAKVSQGTLDAFWSMCMAAGFPAAYDGIKAFSETDFSEDLKKFDLPTLIIHGDDDQIVPINISAQLSAKQIKGAVLKVYKGAPHGLPTTYQEQFNADLLQFAKEETKAAETATRTRRSESSTSELRA